MKVVAKVKCCHRSELSPAPVLGVSQTYWVSRAGCLFVLSVMCLVLVFVCLFVLFVLSCVALLLTVVLQLMSYC